MKELYGRKIIFISSHRIAINRLKNVARFKKDFDSKNAIKRLTKQSRESFKDMGRKFREKFLGQVATISVFKTKK